MKQLLISKYIWVSSYNDQQIIIDYLTKGIISIIRPSCVERLNRWRNVLSWYGLSMGSEYNDIMSLPKTDESNAVVSFDEFSALPAKIYALASGRSYLKIEKWTDIADFVASRQIKSVMIFGSCDKFISASTIDLNEHLDIPWGFVTAKDSAGLSFVLAKLLAGRQSCRSGYLEIDAINKRIVKLLSNEHKNQENKFAEIEYKLLQSTIDNDWHTVAIQAHGEGGHIHLDSMILCALDTSTEMYGKHSLKGGCRIEKGIHLCKRANKINRPTMFIGSIRAYYTLLLSCSSSLTPCELNKSNISSVIAISEGYSSSAVLTNQATAIEEHENQMFFELLVKNISLGFVVTFLNKIKRHWFDKSQLIQPYILFGDPSGAKIPISSKNLNQKITIDKHEIVTLTKLSEEKKMNIIGIETADLKIEIFRGTNVVAIFSPESEYKNHIKLIDRTEEVERLYSNLLGLIKRLQDSDFFLKAVQDTFANAKEMTSDLKYSFADMHRVHLRLSKFAINSILYCEQSRKSGVSQISPNNFNRLKNKLINLWDKEFILLMSKVLSGDILYLIFKKILFIRRTKFKSHCQFCQASLLHLELKSYFNDSSRVKYHCQSCQLCGEQEIWSPDSYRMRIYVKPVIFIGRSFEIDFRLFNENNERPDFSTGRLFIKLSSYIQQIIEVSENQTKIKLYLPEDVIPDLYKLRIFWVSNINMSYRVMRLNVVNLEQK